MTRPGKRERLARKRTKRTIVYTARLDDVTQGNAGWITKKVGRKHFAKLARFMLALPWPMPKSGKHQKPRRDSR